MPANEHQREQGEPAAGTAHGPGERPCRRYAPAAGVVLAAAAYYWLRWPSFAALVEALDYMPYLQDFVGHYYPMSRQVLHDPTPVAGYLYPSFFAVLLTPIAALDLAAAVAVWTVLQLALVAGLCRVSARGSARPTPRGFAVVVGLVVTSTPVLHNLKWGQVSILVTVCVLAAVLARRPSRAWLGGTLLGFAAAVKLYPGLFALLLLQQRRWRAFAAFGLAAVACYVVVPTIVLGPTGWWSFEQTIAAGAKNLDVAGNISSQNFANVVSRWIFLATGAPADADLLTPLRVASRALGVGCLLLVLPLRRRDPDDLVLPLVAVFASLAFLLETSWPHYFVHLPFCQAAVLATARTLAGPRGERGSSRLPRCLAALALASAALASVFALDLSGHWSRYYGYGALFVANLLLLIAVALVAFAGPVCRPPAAAAARAP